MIKLDLDDLTVETFAPSGTGTVLDEQTPDTGTSNLLGCTLYVTCTCNCHTPAYDCA